MSGTGGGNLRDRGAALRRLVAAPLSYTVAALRRLGVHPNALTLLALACAFGAAALIVSGRLPAAGLLLLLSQPLDALDGELARRSGLVSTFGAVLDSTSDRIVDGIILAAIGYHMAAQGQLSWLAVAMAAMLGSLLVSYVRARSEGAGVPTRRGAFTRVERVIVTLLALLLPPLLRPALLVLALGSGATVLQRLWDIRQMAGRPPKYEG